MVALELECWAHAPTSCVAFPQIAAPTLIVCGERENADGSADLAAAALPRGIAVVTPDFGHLQIFWRSDVTAPIIRSFLQEHAPA
jgi:pimeloyl-ACP methyl ester carboxylesterase